MWKYIIVLLICYIGFTLSLGFIIDMARGVY